ncbi:ATP-binding protein [Shewanella submarina]|uniref:histidine kinase n=1 Tax=Shewanella submarina TaxID=2016376 RepID=A0ABV7GBS2_9GAMM|nr:ATP-binding protein [Shewanella submarina]MCL1036891.1 ATP-binding protein [Shewanella submarina]
MDSNAIQSSTQTSDSALFAQVLAEIGKLQARFILGDDVLFPVCQEFAELSQSSSVLLVDVNSISEPEMPEHAACWCHDTVRFLSLWKEVRDWPFAEQEAVVHRWRSFVVWPLPSTNTLIFFREPQTEWLEFLMDHQQSLSQSLMGMLAPQTRNWREQSGQHNLCGYDAEIFRSVVSNSEDMILVLNLAENGESTVIYANAAATSISLYPRSQLIGHPAVKIFDSSKADDESCDSLMEALKTQEEFDGELWIERADGEKALLLIHLVQLGNDGQSGLFALVGRDRTEQKKMQLAMARTQKMQAIGELVGGIAHDFNNILGVMKGNIELMELKNRDEKLEKYLNTAFKACQRGTDLTRRLLQFSRQEQFNACNLSVNEIVSGLEDLFSKSLTSSVSISIELASNVSSDIWVDKGDLEDALLNLAINARDAMGGEGELIIRTGEEDIEGVIQGPGGSTNIKPGRYVWISVRDTGTGIPPEILEKIYDPFFTTKDKSKGTGLGLAMTYGFVKRSKGYMNVVDTGPDGTEFRLWFPASDVEQVNKSQTEPRQQSPRTLQVEGKLKALVVDDEVELLQVLSDYCGMLGIEVESFSDPLQVKSRYGSDAGEIDILITDVLMPGGMNGYELAQALHNNTPDLKVLLISGFIHDIGVTKKEEMPYQVLNKPFDLESFSNALKQAGISFVEREGE